MKVSYIFKRDDKIGDYQVLFPIKNGINAETYRVKSKSGKVCFLKLFYPSKIHRTAFSAGGDILEIELLKEVDHENIVSYLDSGEVVSNGSKYIFMVLDFISGETLADRLARGDKDEIELYQSIIVDLLTALDYLHTLPDPIIHNEVTPQNIMLDLTDPEMPVAKLIDFGYARRFHQPNKSYNKEHLNLNYIASECFNNIYSPQSDIFSAGAVYYNMLSGFAPWFKPISNFSLERGGIEDDIIQERKRALGFSNFHNISEVEENTKLILKKALTSDPELRFKSANDFIDAINGENEVEDVDLVRLQKSDKQKTENKTLTTKAKGSGFDSIAGMDDLKRLLTVDVINALKDPEKYKKYDIPFPNGILFYGPPRCGKTFFAKKFAEEVGYNYMYIKPSTLKSRYVNATQENIAKMFEEAEKNAPTIIFIDELNELLPNRDSEVHEMSKSAVNEMLAQMDRTGEKGIFVVGATNYPNMIDPAILGAGRLEKKFYIGPPDFQLTQELFKVYLKKKPLDFGIDYEKLAKLTEHRVTAEIELICSEAARMALQADSKVTMQIIEKAIVKVKPTISLAELRKYEEIRRKIEGEDGDDEPSGRPRIGFKS